MDVGEFYDRIEAHPELEGQGIDEGGDGGKPAALILHKLSGGKFRVELESVEQHSWETLEEVLTGRREPRVLSHMTRVVGYFSKVENWNRSKVAELRGRQSGNYSVTGTGAAEKNA
jgi:hypothetical protein